MTPQASTRSVFWTAPGEAVAATEIRGRWQGPARQSDRRGRGSRPTTFDQLLRDWREEAAATRRALKIREKTWTRTDRRRMKDRQARDRAARQDRRDRRRQVATA